MQTIDTKYNTDITFYDTQFQKFLGTFGFMESGKIVTGNPNWTLQESIEHELIHTLAAEITAEIDREILKKLLGKIC